ncbi:MAG: hypothetical protein ACOYY2_03910 [Actinomycetota bacterium]
MMQEPTWCCRCDLRVVDDPERPRGARHSPALFCALCRAEIANEFAAEIDG